MDTVGNMFLVHFFYFYLLPYKDRERERQRQTDRDKHCQEHLSIVYIEVHLVFIIRRQMQRILTLSTSISCERKSSHISGRICHSCLRHGKMALQVIFNFYQCLFHYCTYHNGFG